MKTTIISSIIATIFAPSLPAAIIQWMDMSPTSVGSSVPNNSVFSLPGVGNVQLTYTTSIALSNVRQQAPFLQNGFVTGNTWTTYEGLATSNSGISGALLPWNLTYTFLSGPVPANTLFLGVSGLGQTTNFGGVTTTVDVSQTGISLGDFNVVSQNFAPTLFTMPTPTSFHLENSLTGAGGIDPHWNTDLHVVQIGDMVSSLTVRVNQIEGDGIQIGLGSVIPEPSSALLVATAGLLMLRRKR